MGYAPADIRPFAVASVEYQSRDLGYGSEFDVIDGYFTGDIDTWGKLTFMPVRRTDNGDPLYLFADELVSVDYMDGRSE